MKTKSSVLFLFVLTVIMATAVCFTACDFGGSGSSDNQQTEPVLYTIQYTDDVGTHQIQVQSGQPYSIENIPSRTGYDFMGLFDAETGGTQYVNGQGASVAPFTDNKNMVLFPQFKAKTYKVILNYGEALVTGSRELSVEYNSELPELPVNLTVANKDFKGWYTEPNCGGTQIADTYGVLPERRLLTEQNFDVENDNGFIYLYAGFKGVPRTVTFHVGDGNAPIEMQIEHGTDISSVVPDYRDEKGYAVLEWTQDPDPTDESQVFRGEITRDIVLYAKTFAPIIELDANGGEEITPVVQIAGKSITLPVPVRKNYKFRYWADASGHEVSYSTMPSESIELTAVWQAMLVFDENGGESVQDISQASGETIELPTPEREGYFFAGWFDEYGEKCEITKMPETSEVLKAGWYRRRQMTQVLLSADDSITCTSTDPVIINEMTIDLSEVLPSNFAGDIILEVSWKAKHENCSTSNPEDVFLAFYSQKPVSSTYLLGWSGISCDSTSSYASKTTTLSVSLTGNTIYTAISSDMNGNLLFGMYNYGIVSDISAVIYYPDTSVMY